MTLTLSDDDLVEMMKGKASGIALRLEQALRHAAGWRVPGRLSHVLRDDIARALASERKERIRAEQERDAYREAAVRHGSQMSRIAPLTGELETARALVVECERAIGAIERWAGNGMLTGHRAKVLNWIGDRGDKARAFLNPPTEKAEQT